jgi:asparagine synthase (glutamine-hydrolysing)
MTHHTVIANLGATFSAGASDQPKRPNGRIAARRVPRPSRSTDPTAQPTSDIAADFDACTLDDQPVTTTQGWRAVIATGRLADVRGAFALAWTDTNGTLHLARDGVGERSLLYSLMDGALVYASTMADLLAERGMSRRIDIAALASYLATAYVPGRATLIEGVFALQPGEHITFSATGLERSAFWQLPAPPPSQKSQGDLTRQLRAALETAVRRRLPLPGQPVSAFLSGGLDSSLVVALAGRLHDAPVRTYSVFFGAQYTNELEHSSLVAHHCGTIHTTLELTPAAVLHHLDDAIGLLNDPIGDPLTVPNALLFREAARHGRVVLNGEGGDPCFGGPKNLPMLLAELYPDYAEPTTREGHFLRAHLKCYDDLPDMLSATAKDALASAPQDGSLARQLTDPRYPDFVARLQAMNITLKGGHHILPKVDAMSAAFGMLPRSPLFDRDIVEVSLTLPSRLKLNGSTEKYLLKEAVRDLLPSSILDRPKSGMLVPVEGWFQGPLLPAAKERLLDGLASYDLFQRAYLERLLAGKLGGLRPRHGAKIWLLLTLESWLRKLQVSR